MAETKYRLHGGKTYHTATGKTVDVLRYYSRLDAWACVLDEYQACWYSSDGRAQMFESCPEEHDVCWDASSRTPPSDAMTPSDAAFADACGTMAERIHALAVAKGWWEGERNDGEILALIHSEVSEALEAHRLGNPPDEKLPDFSAVEVELADVVIRVMDYAAARGYRLGEAVVAKYHYNEGRAYRHGKAF